MISCFGFSLHARAVDTSAYGVYRNKNTEEGDHALFQRLCHWLAQPGGPCIRARQTSRRRRRIEEFFKDMAKRSDRNLLVGLDIGTSKVVAIVGEIKADGVLEIIGIGSHPSRGLKK